MTRDEMITEVIRIAARPGPFDDDLDLSFFDRQDKGRRKFLERVSDESLDLLLDLFVDPPDWQRIWPDLLEGWELEIQELISDWATRSPDLVIPSVGKLLAVERARPFMIGAMAEIAQPACLPWLKPLVGQVMSLTEEEIIDLVAALGDSKSPEARELLERLQKTVPPKMQKARGEIQSYRDHLNKQLAQQG